MSTAASMFSASTIVRPVKRPSCWSRRDAIGGYAGWRPHRHARVYHCLAQAANPFHPLHLMRLRIVRIIELRFTYIQKCELRQDIFSRVSSMKIQFARRRRWILAHKQNFNSANPIGLCLAFSSRCRNRSSQYRCGRFSCANCPVDRPLQKARNSEYRPVRSYQRSRSKSCWRGHACASCCCGSAN